MGPNSHQTTGTSYNNSPQNSNSCSLSVPTQNTFHYQFLSFLCFLQKNSAFFSLKNGQNGFRFSPNLVCTTGSSNNNSPHNFNSCSLSISAQYSFHFFFLSYMISTFKRLGNKSNRVRKTYGFWRTARLFFFKLSFKWHTILFLMLFCTNSAHFSDI